MTLLNTTNLNFIKLPTVQELSNNSSSWHVNLLLLRTLMTSDLFTCHYMLLKGETIQDIVNSVQGLNKLDKNAGIEISEAEDKEMDEYLNRLINYTINELGSFTAQD